MSDSSDKKTQGNPTDGLEQKLQSNQPIDIDELEIDILIIAKQPKRIQQAAHFLVKRGWPTTVVSNLAQAIKHCTTNPPDFILISMNLAHPNIAKLPQVFKQSFDATCVIFAETGDSATTAMVNNSSEEHKISGLPSGPALQRSLRKILMKLYNPEAEASENSLKSKTASGSLAKETDTNTNSNVMGFSVSPSKDRSPAYAGSVAGDSIEAASGKTKRKLKDIKPKSTRDPNSQDTEQILRMLGEEGGSSVEAIHQSGPVAKGAGGPIVQEGQSGPSDNSTHEESRDSGPNKSHYSKGQKQSPWVPVEGTQKPDPTRPNYDASEAQKSGSLFTKGETKDAMEARSEGSSSKLKSANQSGPHSSGQDIGNGSSKAPDLSGAAYNPNHQTKNPESLANSQNQIENQSTSQSNPKKESPDQRTSSTAFRGLDSMRAPLSENPEWVHKAISDTLIKICKPEQEKEQIIIEGLISHISALKLDMNQQSGLILLSSADDGQIESAVLELFRTEFLANLKAASIEAKLGHAFGFNLPEISFADWTSGSGMFMFKHPHSQSQIQASFQALAKSTEGLIVDPTTKMIPIPIREISPDTVVNFKAYLYLKKNNLFYLYLNENRNIHPMQLERLEKSKVTYFYIKEVDQEKYQNYTGIRETTQNVQNFLINQKKKAS